jgi:hypothetical protein
MQPTQVNRINPLNPLRALLSSLPNKMYHSAYYALSIAVVATALSSPPLLESRRAGGHRRTTAHNGFPLPLHGRRVISTFQPLRAHAHDASQRTVPMYDQAAVAALAKRHAFASDVSEAVCCQLYGLKFLSTELLVWYIRCGTILTFMMLINYAFDSGGPRTKGTH